MNVMVASVSPWGPGLVAVVSSSSTTTTTTTTTVRLCSITMFMSVLLYCFLLSPDDLASCYSQWILILGSISATLSTSEKQSISKGLLNLLPLCSHHLHLPTPVSRSRSPSSMLGQNKQFTLLYVMPK